MTSSPGRIPATTNARCSALVQFETAQAYRLPTTAANSRSKAATSGPCVTQPEWITLAAASASSAPITGRISGSRVRTSDTNDLTLPLPPSDETAKALLKRNVCTETNHPFRFAGIGKTPGHRINLPLGTKLRAEIGI